MVTYTNMDVGTVCLSTDTKPTEGIANGAKLTELDTGKVYRFDAEGKTWIETDE